MRHTISLPEATQKATLERKTAIVKDAFALMDLDGAGTLSVEEIATTCSVIGLNLSVSEVEDVIHEFDSDASGQLDADEFVQLVMAKSKSPNDEMREAWSYFDVDGDGCIDIDELKDGLERVGIRLAPWELREMMQVADLNQNHMISGEEFALAYGSEPWIRAQGVSGLMQRIMDTWKMLDKDESGSVSVSELIESLIPMGANRMEIDQMVKTADVDGDGAVSFKEFLHAYHSNDWFKVRLLSVASSELQHAKEEQDAFYKEAQREERADQAEKHSSLTSKDALMKRRALRRNKEVRIAINKFWKAIEYFAISDAWVPKELYFTYHLKLRKAVHKVQEDQMSHQESMDIAEEDWKVDSKCENTRSDTKTKRMECREMHGRPPYDPKPEGVEVIGYSEFFDSLFELADTMVGREAGEIDGELYAQYIMEMLHTIITVEIDNDGDATYRWADSDSVYIGKGETWKDVDELNLDTCPGPGKCFDQTCDIAQSKLCEGDIEGVPSTKPDKQLSESHWFRHKPMVVETDLQAACTRLRDALETASTHENHMLVQSCKEKLESLVQAANTAGGLQEAERQMLDLEPLVVALCNDLATRGRWLSMETLQVRCASVKHILGQQSKVVQTRVIGALQREAIKGAIFERTRSMLLLEEQDGPDDLAMAEVAARRIQAVYRGRKGRAKVQKLADATRDGSPIFQIEAAVLNGSPNTTNIGIRSEPPMISPCPFNASVIERAEWTSSTIFEVDKQTPYAEDPDVKIAPGAREQGWTIVVTGYWSGHPQRIVRDPAGAAVKSLKIAQHVFLGKPLATISGGKGMKGRKRPRTGHSGKLISWPGLSHRRGNRDIVRDYAGQHLGACRDLDMRLRIPTPTHKLKFNATPLYNLQSSKLRTAPHPHPSHLGNSALDEWREKFACRPLTINGNGKAESVALNQATRVSFEHRPRRQTVSGYSNMKKHAKGAARSRGCDWDCTCNYCALEQSDHLTQIQPQERQTTSNSALPPLRVARSKTNRLKPTPEQMFA